MATPSSLQLNVPAKVNLFLHVTGQRADGYHLLQSIFTAIDWFDRLTLSVRDDGRICRTGGLKGLVQEDDLVYRAAQALRTATGCALGADMHLEKHIPAGAGMGGGSSDAAYTLMGLNQLWGTGLGADKLRTLAEALGADVPFFLNGAPAFVEGIGERMQTVPLPKKHLLVVKPPVFLSTPSIFKSPELTRNSNPVTIAVFGFDRIWHTIASHCRNDLQVVAEHLSAPVALTRQWLTQACEETNGMYARMTGSGSACFAVFDTAEQAQRAQTLWWQKAERHAQHDPACTEWVADSITKLCCTLDQNTLENQMVR